jgi:hypothetical protein
MIFRNGRKEIRPDIRHQMYLRWRGALLRLSDGLICMQKKIRA